MGGDEFYLHSVLWSMATFPRKKTASQDLSRMAASAVPCERNGAMKWSRFFEAQIVYAIRQAESETSGGDSCRQLDVSNATFYAWEKVRPLGCE